MTSSIDWSSWRPTEKAALLFLFDEEKVLLIHKKKGLGAGKINAPGGRVEVGETFAEAAIRETKEETGLDVSELIETATLSFSFVDGYGLFSKAFFAYRHLGTLTETDEALPFWHPWSDLPWNKMWADDPWWLVPALQGNYVEGRFVFSGDVMLDKDVKILPRPAAGSSLLSVDNRR